MAVISDVMMTHMKLIPPDQSVRRTVDMMAHHDVDSFVVVEHGRFLGVVTARDLCSVHANRWVIDVMGTPAVTVKPMCSVFEAAGLMVQHDVDRLPVVLDSELLGIVTKETIAREIGRHEDGLTGLQSSGYLFWLGESLLRQGHGVTVMFIDLDDFASMNKDVGHVVGDTILCQIRDYIGTRVIDTRDTLFRYGGDEFVLLTTMPKSEADAFARELKEDTKTYPWAGGVKVCLSIGVVVCQEPPTCKHHAGDCMKALVNRASLVSTQAKRSGDKVITELFLTCDADGEQAAGYEHDPLDTAI